MLITFLGFLQVYYAVMPDISGFPIIHSFLPVKILSTSQTLLPQPTKVCIEQKPLQLVGVACNPDGGRSLCHSKHMGRLRIVGLANGSALLAGVSGGRSLTSFIISLICCPVPCQGDSSTAQFEQFVGVSMRRLSTFLWI